MHRKQVVSIFAFAYNLLSEMTVLEFRGSQQTECQTSLAGDELMYR